MDHVSSDSDDVRLVWEAADKAIDDLDSRVRETVSSSVAPFNGKIITLELTIAWNTFPHTLGRTPEGWWLVDKVADVRVRRGEWDAVNATWWASMVATVKMWIY